MVFPHVPASPFLFLMEYFPVFSRHSSLGLTQYCLCIIWFTYLFINKCKLFPIPFLEITKISLLFLPSVPELFIIEFSTSLPSFLPCSFPWGFSLLYSLNVHIHILPHFLSASSLLLSLSLSHTYLFSSKEVKNSQILLSFLHKWSEKTPIFNQWSLILFCILFPPFISIIKKIINFPIKPEGITFCSTFTFTLIVFIILSIFSEIYSAMLIPTLFSVRKIGIRILPFLFTSRVNLDTFRSSVNVNFYKS